MKLSRHAGNMCCYFVSFVYALNIEKVCCIVHTFTPLSSKEYVMFIVVRMVRVSARQAGSWLMWGKDWVRVGVGAFVRTQCRSLNRSVQRPALYVQIYSETCTVCTDLFRDLH